MRLKGLSALVLGLLPAVSFAADPSLVPSHIPTVATNKLGSYLFGIQTYLLGFAAALAVLFIIVGGAQLMTSGGNPQKLEVAKKTLTYAIIGLAIVLMAGIIFRLISGSILPTLFTGKSTPYN